MRCSRYALARTLLQHVYSGYQKGKLNTQSSETFELHEEDPEQSEDRGFYNTVSLSSLRKQDESILHMQKTKEARPTQKNPSQILSTEKLEGSLTNKFIPVNNPYLTQHSSNTSLFASVNKKIDHTLSYPNTDVTISDPPDQLQTSPFKSTQFGSACMAAIPQTKNIAHTIAQARNPRAAKEHFWENSGRYRDSKNLTPKQQKLCQKRLNDVVLKEIMMQFQLYKDEERVIPLHLTKINSSLCDETIEYIGQKGGLLKFVTDRPRYFRIKKVKRSGGWYVTTSVDACEKFAGNFSRKIKTTVYEEVDSQCLEKVNLLDEVLDTTSKTEHLSSDACEEEEGEESEAELQEGSIPEIREEEVS
ncbi:hypothetical protein XU18_0030 [Perkinsela sp. CCAP 1560/4]|nr:hypothetical protein XU18_0030 [Perkinsela sp. CCAP 1560/4]|eukprot:KNH09345.1 hypothetical protein XU18_0030 [Perkinsela sp. CCAP 1560/4]